MKKIHSNFLSKLSCTGMALDRGGPRDENETKTAGNVAARESICHHKIIISDQIVTPKGVLLLAKCHASATHEDSSASRKSNLPKEKLM